MPNKDTDDETTDLVEFEDPSSIRSTIANGLLIALAIFAGPALIGSLSRIPSIGWQPVMGLHIAAVAVIAITTLFRHRLPYIARASVIVGVLILVSLGGFLNFALNGAGQPALLISAVIAGVLFGTRGGVIVLAAGGAVFFAIGFAYSAGWLGLRFDPTLYNVDLNSWISGVGGFLFFGAAALASVVALNSALFRLVSKLRNFNEHLAQEVSDRTRDLTDEVEARKQNERVLEDSQRNLTAIFDNVAEAIITIGETGDIHRFNPAAEKIFGYSAAEISGRNITVLMPDPFRTDYSAILESYVKTGKPNIIGVGQEVEGLRKDDSKFPMDLSISGNVGRRPTPFHRNCARYNRAKSG